MGEHDKIKMPTPTKILILSASPKNENRLRIDEEVREIEEGLLRSKYRDQFIIKAKWAVRLKDFRRAMLDYEPQILHFCGHGEVEGIKVENNDGDAVLVDSEALSKFFGLFANKLECVILNTCFSKKQAEIIKKHIRYVIGMSFAVQDKAAIEFSTGFYDALGAGKSFEDAFKFGCNAIHFTNNNFPGHLVPVLLKKSSALFPTPHHVFISYCCEKNNDTEKDKEVAFKICSTLEAKNIHCWIAPRDIPAGSYRLDEISKAINKTRIVIAVISSNTENSKWMTRELLVADEKKKFTIPFRINNVELQNGLHFKFVDSQFIDAFPNPVEDYLETLVKGVQCILFRDEIALPPIIIKTDSKEEKEVGGGENSSEELKKEDNTESAVFVPDRLEREEQIAEADEATVTSEKQRTDIPKRKNFIDKKQFDDAETTEKNKTKKPIDPKIEDPIVIKEKEPQTPNELLNSPLKNVFKEKKYIIMSAAFAVVLIFISSFVNDNLFFTDFSSTNESISTKNLPQKTDKPEVNKQRNDNSDTNHAKKKTENIKNQRKVPLTPNTEADEQDQMPNSEIKKKAKAGNNDKSGDSLNKTLKTKNPEDTQKSTDTVVIKQMENDYNTLKIDLFRNYSPEQKKTACEKFLTKYYVPGKKKPARVSEIILTANRLQTYIDANNNARRLILKVKEHLDNGNLDEADDTLKEITNTENLDNKLVKEVKNLAKRITKKKQVRLEYEQKNGTKSYNAIKEPVSFTDYLKFKQKYKNSIHLPDFRSRVLKTDVTLPPEKYWPESIKKNNKSGYYELEFRKNHNGHKMVYIPDLKIWIDKYEVSWKQFKAFLEKEKIPPPLQENSKYIHKGDDYPAVVTLENAQKYCREYGLRLPKMSEWEYVAGKGKFKFPWGNDLPDANGVYRANFDSMEGTIEKDGFEGTAPVKKFKSFASPFGVVNMAGNVWEWVQENLSKGGDFFSDIDDLKIAKSKQAENNKEGFRCVKEE